MPFRYEDRIHHLISLGRNESPPLPAESANDDQLPGIDVPPLGGGELAAFLVPPDSDEATAASEKPKDESGYLSNQTALTPENSLVSTQTYNDPRFAENFSQNDLD